MLPFVSFLAAPVLARRRPAVFLSGTWPFVLTARFEPDAAGLSRASSQHADSRSRDRGAASTELMKMIVSGSNEGAGNAWCALRARPACNKTRAAFTKAPAETTGIARAASWR